MYSIGELVQYGNSGICKIEEILHGMPGLSNTADYYLMVPVHGKDGKIYAPVENENIKMRKILSKDEIHAIMDDAPNVTSVVISNEKQCESVYKEALYSTDCSKWLGLLKTLYSRKDLRLRQGKKVTATDERYLKNAEERLYDELSVIDGAEEARGQIDGLEKRMLDSLE